MPGAQAEHGAGSLIPLQDFNLDISASGPFFAPFWATFGYYHPGEMSGSANGAFFAPIFMYTYLLFGLVLFINLLTHRLTDLLTN